MRPRRPSFLSRLTGPIGLDRTSMSLFDQGTELVGLVRSPDGKLQTKELLDVCRSILPIVGVSPPCCKLVGTAAARGTCPLLAAAAPFAACRHSPRSCPRLAAADKLGTGFMIVKHDVGGNIDRLATCAATKPDVYQADVFAMVRALARFPSTWPWLPCRWLFPC